MNSCLKIALVVFAAGIGIRFAAHAQTPSPALRFEVASIRLSPPGPELDNPSFLAYRAGKATSFCMVCISGSHYDVYQEWLKELIARAYGIDSRLVVAPDWLNRTEGMVFTIHALLPEGATTEQIPDMLKSLLEERFHLVAHLAPAEQPGYALVVAKNGPKLKQPREIDRSTCELWVASGPSPNQMCRSTQDDGDRTVTTAMSTNTYYGPMVSVMSRGESLEIHMEYFRITMPKLAENLTEVVSTADAGVARPGNLVQVLDRTGIEGAWDVLVDRVFGDLALPVVSASLEKQGLRLEKTIVPTQKLIVDRVDKVPTEN